MNKKLYVGNLSYSTTEDELRQLFAEVGPVVSANLVTDRMTGQSRGFGFVEMESQRSAPAPRTIFRRRGRRQRPQ
jgi:RNA recognition motif-containing protein